MNVLNRRALFSVAAIGILAAVALAGCARTGDSIVPATQANAVARTQPYVRVTRHGKTRVRLTIRIPRKQRHGGLEPRFVSPSTQSMTVNVTGTSGTQTPSGYPKTVDLTANSGGCTSSLASTICELTLTLSAGHYLATVTTYDQTGGTGHVLSAAQAVPFTALVGHANTIALTLGGYPATIVATPVSPGFLQTSIGGLKLYGSFQPQQLLVQAEDADGNTIVGAGAPRIGASSATPAQLFVTPPPVTAQNIVTLQAATSGNPPAITPGIVTLNLSATPPNDSGASAVNAAVNVQMLHSAIYYTLCAAADCSGSNNYVLGFLDGNTNDITPGAGFNLALMLSGLAADDNGTLWVTTQGTMVSPYNMNFSNTGQSVGYGISADINGAASLAVDANGTLFVSNTGNGTLVEYPVGFELPQTMLSIASSSLAVDNADNVYAGSGANVNVYPPGDSTRSEQIPIPAPPVGVAIDSDGLLYVLTASEGVYEIQQPGTTISDTSLINGFSAPSAIAVDATRTVYVANNGDGTNATINEYPAGSTSATQPSVSITLGPGYVTGIAVVPRPL